MLMERFNKVTFRDFQDNTRLNINNSNYAEQKVKRDRQISYWKNNVIQNFLPPIRNNSKGKKLSNASEMKRQLYLQRKSITTMNNYKSSPYNPSTISAELVLQQQQKSSNNSSPNN